MGEEFEGRDLSESVFWGVDLRKSTFRDADLSGSTFFHVRASDVSVDGVVDRLVVNGVDVTPFVNANDRWYPLRTMLEPLSAAAMREAWEMMRREWAVLGDRADRLGDEAANLSVGGEWSYRDTLRHLVFAMDKWFSWPILGERTFSPLGLPNTGSRDFGWPGLDLSCEPTLAEVRAVRETRCARFTAHVEGLDVATLPEEVEVPENGAVPALMCFHAVLEEEFEHLRYATRDLTSLGG